MQTAAGSHGTSSTFKDFIEKHPANDLKFKEAIEEYKKINIHYTVSRDDYPTSRNHGVSTYDLVVASAVNSKNLTDFKLNCLGFLPLETSQNLTQLLRDIESYYDTMVWNENKPKLEKQLQELSKFENVNIQIFNRIKQFYDSSWTADVPFQVALYPIPGANGFITATPHVNNLCVAIFSDETDYNSKNGVVLHEMCHVLYKEQKIKKQFEIENHFKENNTLYSKFAYSYLDEALATAIGNGWAYKKVNHKLDDREWYADATINKFAKLIYPKVESYIEKDKSIDKEFLTHSVKTFAANFPKAIQDYTILFNKTVVYANDLKEREILEAVSENFQIYTLNLSTPIFHPYSIESINNSPETQLFIIHNNQQETLDVLKEYFPLVGSYKYKNASMNLTFFDIKGRAIIVLVLKDVSELSSELSKMKRQVFFDIKQPLQF